MAGQQWLCEQGSCKQGLTQPIGNKTFISLTKINNDFQAQRKEKESEREDNKQKTGMK